MSSEDNFIGKSLGNYHITDEIGSGGFGNVYLGQHTILTERSVAIKRIHSHLGSPEERERFLEEARLLERLKHPHILHIFDVGIYEGFPYLVAEYAPNGSLRERLKQYARNPPPLEEALNILSQVGQGLYYAHQRNVIHRDLKPANILFNEQGEALLADFGIATTLSTSSITHAAIIGTPPYMAPEQFQGSVSKESDQYALGCIAYELFTGKLPFNATDFFAMGFEHLTKQPVAPTQLNPHLPMHIERAILKALAKQRGNRHADVKAFIMALYTPGDQKPFIPDTYPVSGPMTPISMQDYSHAPTINQAHLFNTPPAAMEQKFSENTPHSTAMKAQTTQETRLLHNQAPVTPVPPLYTSPFKAVEQENAQQNSEPATPLPPTTFEGMPAHYNQGPVTPFPLSDELITGVTNTMLLSNSMLPAATQAGKKRTARRKWTLIIAAVLFIIVANTGLFYYLFSRNSSQSNTNNSSNQQSLTTNLGVTATLGQHPTPKNSLTAVSTHGSTVVPTSAPTQGPNPTATNAPNPTATPSPTSTPVVTETHTVSFLNNCGTNGVSTTHTYHGTVLIQVSGSGQEAKYKRDDAFYQITDSYGNQLNPSQYTYTNTSLWINSNPADELSQSQQAPSPQSSHFYSFTIQLPQAGYLTFSIGDNYPYDNTGSLTVTVTQK